VEVMNSLLQPTEKQMHEETKLPKTLAEALAILQSPQIAKTKSESKPKRQLSRFVDTPMQKDYKEE
jgi:hypothetical protein